MVRHLVVLFSLVINLSTSSLIRAKEKDAQSINECKSLLNGKHRPWINGRRLSEYYDLLGPGFMFHLSRLNEEHLWIDMGCGSGTAIKDYYGFYSPMITRKRQMPVWPWASLGIWTNYFASKLVSPKKKARTMAFDRELDISHWEELYETLEPWQQDLYHKVTFVPGFLLEDYDIEDEILLQTGKADIITDVFGVMSYTYQPDLILRKYIDSLSDHGKAYILAFDTTIGNNHIVIKQDGRKVNLKRWMKEIPGLKVKNLNFWNSISISKPNSSIVIPKLKLIYYNKRKLPPRRTFIEVGP